MAYGLAFVLFLGAMLAKTTAFSLPAVILLNLLVEAGTHPVACGYCADLAVLCRGHRPLPGNGVAGEERCRGERDGVGHFFS